MASHTEGWLEYRQATLAGRACLRRLAPGSACRREGKEIFGSYCTTNTLVGQAKSANPGCDNTLISNMSGHAEDSTVKATYAWEKQKSRLFDIPDSHLYLFPF